VQQGCFCRNREGMFQQDGARATIAWLDTNIKHYILLEDWPPNSPGLSPTENVWTEHYGNSRLCRPRASVTATLKHRLRKAWKSIYLSTLQNLIGSMPNRLKAIIKNNGDTIPY